MLNCPKLHWALISILIKFRILNHCVFWSGHSIYDDNLKCVLYADI